jgi:uncharacterized protein (AIM24 family)
MARFEVIDDEGVSFVKVTLSDETVCTESGALCYLFGDVEVDASLPSIGRAVKNVLAHQSIVRPTYSGTGTLYLESSVGGFEVFDMDGSSWILEPGAYWASEADVSLNLFRERVMTSLFTGEGFILLRTKVSGSGKIVLKTNGPVELIELHNERLATDGSYVLARSEGVSYRVRRSTRSLLGSFLTEERRLRLYEGTGRVLVSSYPYWRQLLHAGNTATRV